MKKICLVLDMMLIMVMLLTVSTYKPKTYKIEQNRQVTYVNSDKIYKEIIEEVAVEVLEDVKEEEVETVEKTVETKEVKEEVVEKKEEVTTNNNQTITTTTNTITAFVGDKFTAKMSGYGQDIGSYTACGYYIGDSIYYNDNTYGKIRILAGGREYPFGTIVKVSNSNEGTFIGIVLDRGGDIGRSEGKKFAFDLLYETSAEAYRKGVSKKANFEILRVGYNG